MLFLVVFIYKRQFLHVFSPLVGSETCPIKQIYLKRVLKMFFIPNCLAWVFTRPFCVTQTSTSRGFEKGNGLLEFIEDHDGSPGNSLRNPETLWKGSRRLAISGFRVWLFLYQWEPRGTPIKESIRTWGALGCPGLTPEACRDTSGDLYLKKTRTTPGCLPVTHITLACTASLKSF